MGHGAARTLEQNGAVDRELDPELSAKLGAALEQMDGIDAEFKAQRDEERFAQQVKTWGQLCKRMDDDLRMVGRLLHASHQLSLDNGIDGGGHTAKPWLEDMQRRFGKLAFHLDEDHVKAVYQEEVLDRVPMSAVDYAWLERCAVAWLLRAVESKS